ncbi:AAA family ATPase [Agrobacterium rhizogenes]|nr:AAA family ATPase [Rhizobium rhizogenes]NTF75131.1 AAA family ATPase [Rhizobium rhizogenes]NTH51525.1 AAA family ATPase [Rhizobium rhizogenes]NTH71109.1 AAA family ATPase [Rhizobium rhizogenes]
MVEAALTPAKELVSRIDGLFGPMTPDERRAVLSVSSRKIAGASGKVLDGPSPSPEGNESDDGPLDTLGFARRLGKVATALKLNSTSDIIGFKQLIERTLPLVGVAIVAGQSTTGKTAVMLSTSFQLARGKDWCGRKVMHKVGIAYLAYEAPGTIEPRWNAICREANVNGDDLPFYAYASPGSLSTNEGWDNLGATILDCVQRSESDYGVRLGMVVIDTVSASGFVAEENSADEWGRSLSKLHEIAKSLGILIVLIHHSGKDSDVNPIRGSGAAYSNADAVIILKVDKDVQTSQTTGRRILLDKIKEGGSEGPLSSYEIIGRVVGTFESGEPLTAAFVRYVDGDETGGKRDLTYVRRVCIELLDRLEAKGDYVTMAKTSKNYAPTKLSRLMDGKVSKAEFTAAIEELLNEGEVSVFNEKSRGRSDIEAIRVTVPKYKR